MDFSAIQKYRQRPAIRRDVIDPHHEKMCIRDRYTPEQLCDIIVRSAGILEIPCDRDGAMELARRSRGTPRIANRLLKRVRDFAEVIGNGTLTRDCLLYTSETGARMFSLLFL